MGALESKELQVVEKPQQLITIEPAKYVALVFEPFAKRLADAKVLAKDVTFDVTTTAGMAVAVKHRATFRDIRVASEKARKERKAPILEIGKLLDSRQKEIEAEIEPFESKFDSAIKEEEQRKEVEKAEAARAEANRQAKIQAAIDDIKSTVLAVAGKSSDEIDAAHIALDFREMNAAEFGKRFDEAVRIRSETLLKLTEMKDAALAREEEARIAAERAEAQRIEFERVAAVQRAEAERLAARDREIEEQAAAARAAQAALDRQAEEARAEANRKAEASRAEQDRLAAEARAGEQRRLDEQAAALRAQQAEIDRVKREEQEAEQARVAAKNAEAERVAREEREAEQARLDAEATERRRVEEEEAAARRAAEEAAHVADQKLRNAAPNLLKALQDLVAVLAPTYADYHLTADLAQAPDYQIYKKAVSAITEATV